MSIVYKVKRSEVASSVPSSGDLAEGELALNLADAKIFSKKADGTVVSFNTSTETPVFFSEEVDLGNLSTASITYDMASLTGGSPASGGGISDIVEDTTPQLGGDLDLNSNDITGTGNISVDGTITQGDSSYYTHQYVMHGVTTNATETEILTVSDSTRIPVSTNTTMFYEVSIVARRTDATGESGSWHLKGCADNFSGTVADVGSVYEIAVAQDDVALAVDVRADNTNNAINVFVTGAASKTIRWTAIIKTTEVAE